MSLPTQSDLCTLRYASLGQPFVQTAFATTTTLAYAFKGQPFIGTGASAAAASALPLHIIIGA